MDKIKMDFTVDEMNIILKALSKESFKDVYMLIGRINDAASEQLRDDPESSTDK
ncbi:hypothetical protein N9231_06290 [Saprospiraceae bacterium]|nr:hypothetical protein [Saprospiraceae bacterium]